MKNRAVTNICEAGEMCGKAFLERNRFHVDDNARETNSEDFLREKILSFYVGNSQSRKKAAR